MKYKFIILIILLLAFILANLHFNNTNVSLPLINSAFPYKIGNWEGKDIKANESVYDMLDKSELLLRMYQNKESGQTATLAVVLTNKRDHIHDPEICYRGQGIAMNKETNLMLPPKNMVKYVFGKKKRIPYSIIYWYTDLNKTYTSRVNFMKHIAYTKFFDKPIAGFALVVIMSPKATKENDLINFAKDVNIKLSKLND